MTKENMVALRLSDEERAELDRVASAFGISRSEVYRRGVQRLLERLPGAPAVASRNHVEIDLDPDFEARMLAAMAGKSGMDRLDVVRMAIRKAYYAWYRQEFDAPPPEEIARLQAVDAEVKAIKAEEAKREAEFRSRKKPTAEELADLKAKADEELRKNGPPPF